MNRVDFLQFTLMTMIMSERTYMAIHPIPVEMFNFGPKVWPDGEISIPKASFHFFSALKYMVYELWNCRSSATVFFPYVPADQTEPRTLAVGCTAPKPSTPS